MKKIYFKLHWSFIVLACGMFLAHRTLAFFCVTLSVVLHEMGHALMARKLGYKLNVISLLPYGACLSGESCFIAAKDDTKIAVAGPLTNVVLVVLSVALLKFIPSLSVFFKEFINSNISTFLFNILPVFPLDGGRVLLNALSKKTNRIKALKGLKVSGIVISFAFAALFVVSCFYKVNFTLGINALFLLMTTFADNKDCFYTKITELDQIDLNYNKMVKTYAVSSESTIFDTYKMIDKYSVCQIFVMDNSGNNLGCLMNKDLKEALMSNPPNTKVESVLRGGAAI